MTHVRLHMRHISSNSNMLKLLAPTVFQRVNQLTHSKLGAVLTTVDSSNTTWSQKRMHVQQLRMSNLLELQNVGIGNKL